MTQPPFVSVVIATRNRQALLARTLDALEAQSYPHDRFEVIVADNGSTDGTAATVRAAGARPSAASIRYLHVAQPGKSHAVNAALALVRGDLIALTDDDVLADRNWLDRMAHSFGDTGADFIAGRILPLWEIAPPAWMSASLYGVLAVPDNGADRLDVIAAGDVVPIGANMAVRRQVTDRIGGLRVDLGKLDGTLRTGEDHEFFLRMLDAGFRGVYEPAAVVHHHVPADRLERSYFRRWLFQNGRDVALLDAAYRPPAKCLLGVPRYHWRSAVNDLVAWIRSAVRGRAASRFAAETRLIWLAGYLRQRWFGAAAAGKEEQRRARTQPGRAVAGAR